MKILGVSLRRSRVSSSLVCAALLVWSGNATARESWQPPQQPAAPIERHAPEPQEQQPPSPVEQQPAISDTTPVPVYDKAIFQSPFPPNQLSFLKQFDGAPSKELWNDKQFHKLLNRILPTGMFHYGIDRSIYDALDIVTRDSMVPVRVLDGRYVAVVGDKSLYLSGVGFVWIDLQDGVALAGFSFHPTNGEPTPSVVVFSRQIVKQDWVAMGQLPPEFATFLRGWTDDYRIPQITARYFITGSNKRILLEHDEEYCAPMDGIPAPDKVTCEDMDFKALDLDASVGDYLDTVHHATNATGWMIDGDQSAWLQVRESSCGMLMACRVRVTRERRDVILHRAPSPHPVAHR